MSSPSSLLPKEHGAYAELAFPLVTGLALARPGLAGIALALAAVFFFLAHEPLAILLGVRGRRLKTQLGDAARRRVGKLLSLGALCALFGVFGAGGAVWPGALFPVVPTLLLIPLVLRGRQKTLVGETLVITAFSTLVLPLAAASGADPYWAAWAALVWWVSFLLGTLEVHAIKARHKGSARSRWTRWGSPVASGLVVLVCLGALALAGLPPALAGPGMEALAPNGLWPALASSGIWPALALLPPTLGILVLSLLRIHPRHLMRVGWTLVGANSLSLVVILSIAAASG